MIKGRLKRFKILLFVSIPLIYLNADASTQPLEQQALRYIQQQMRSELTGNDDIEIEIQPLSSRLKLSPCRQEVSFSSRQPIAPGRFSLKASCQFPKRWTLSIRGKIKVMREVIFSLRPLPRNSILSSTDIKLGRVDISMLRNGYFTDTQTISGYELKRAIPQNKVLTPNMLLPPMLVQKMIR